MKKLAAISALTTAVLFSHQAFADTQTAGWYAGAALGSSTIKDDVSTVNLTSYSRDIHSTGAKLFAGYRLNDTISFEGAYTDFGKEKYTYTASGVTGGGDIKVTGITFAAIGRLPVANNVDLFGKFGAADLMIKYKDNWSDLGTPGQTSGSKSTVVPMLGIGADFAITSSIKLRTEYEAYGKAKIVDDSNLGSAKVNVDLLSIGVLFSF